MNQSQSLFILGRQPALGLAELESLYGSENVTPLVSAAIVNVDPKVVVFYRLGGSVKLAKVLTELPYTDFSKLANYIRKNLPAHLQYLPEGKVKFGLSCFGLKTNVAEINRTTLGIKKVIKAAGKSVRVVPNKELALGSAQVIHNQLTSPVGMELLLVASEGKTILAQTVAEQDIEAYAARDHGRPKRDSKVGMLPPKLAQIIINLAVGSDDAVPGTLDTEILDPFCGTGVVLQEALLMGYNPVGSDLDPRMVKYTVDNIHWLDHEKIATFARDPIVEVADATKHTWTPSPTYIACETYLGRPFSSQPDIKVLQEVMQDVNLIHKRFLQNITRQLGLGQRLCLAVPAWRIGSSFKHLKVLDNLEELGYNRIEFVHARREDLIYHREGQVVARELVVLVRK